MLRRLLCCGLLLPLVIGCGGNGNPPTENVSGTVTLDGNPVEGATVAFIPDDSANGKPAVGRTDASGKFKLTSFESGDGAMLGSYKIQVDKYDTPDGGVNPYGPPPEDNPPPPNRKLTEEEEQALQAQGYTASAATPQGKEEKAKNHLPAKYGKIATSGLTYTVVEGDNDVKLELKK